MPENTVKEIVKKASRLEVMPHIGRIVPELEQDDIREVFIYSYRIVYQIFSEQIVILAVIHGFRNMQAEDIASID